MNLYALTGDFRKVEDLIIENGGEITEEVEALLDTSTLAVKTKVENIQKILLNLKANTNAYDIEIKRLSALKKTSQNNHERLKNWTEGCMKAHGIENVQTPIGKMIVCTSQPSVEVTNRREVPEEYLKEVESVVDKAKALQALKDGVDIPGLHLDTTKTHLRIK